MYRLQHTKSLSGATFLFLLVPISYISSKVDAHNKTMKLTYSLPFSKHKVPSTLSLVKLSCVAKRYIFGILFSCLRHTWKIQYVETLSEFLQFVHGHFFCVTHLYVLATERITQGFRLYLIMQEYFNTRWQTKNIFHLTVSKCHVQENTTKWN